MQKELISQKRKEIDSVLVSICGGVIGIIGIIAEYKIISQSPLDIDALFNVGVGTALGGLSLATLHKIRNFKT